MNRRDFLKVSGSVGGGLVVAIYLAGCKPAPAPGETPTTGPLPTNAPDAIPTDMPTEALFEPNAYLVIASNGTITVRVHRSEMGQGVQTALPMLIAEELEVGLSAFNLEQAPADRAYGDQVTGGSVSMSSSYMTLRRAGALARLLLESAAAQILDVPLEECHAQKGQVVHAPSGRALGYGELAATAAQMPLPSGDIALKDRSQFKLIGTSQQRVDNRAIVHGALEFGMDVRLPGMLTAAVARSPLVMGGALASYDDSAALAVPGVRAVVEIETGFASPGLAVVADNTWAALQGRQALKIEWQDGPAAELTSDGIRQALRAAAQARLPASEKSEEGVTQYIEAEYELPYLAHAPLEPMNCVADVRADGCDVWAPTQDRQQALSIAQRYTGSMSGPTHIHVPHIGGAFGRRLRVDYVGDAVQISRAVGAPVHLIWVRDDDFQHDFYRPASHHLMRAGVDKDGRPLTWRHVVGCQSIGGSSSEMIDGASALPYRLKVTAIGAPVDLPVPVGYWRSVYNSQTAFANECFFDEIAAASGRDPYELRMELMKEDSPMRAPLQKAAEMIGWGRPLPAGSGRGIACHSTFGVTPVAQAVEVEVSTAGEVRVKRVTCAIDCGIVVNPDLVAAQMEGGIVLGLTAALKGQITLQNGRVEQRSYADYPLLTMGEMPEIEVALLPSERIPSGVGEMGVPPIAPAVVNAIYAATGKRVRKLPVGESLAGSR